MNALPPSSAEQKEFLHDVLEGLSAEQKTVPGKYLWDETGSSLFDAICRSDDYYVAKLEMSLLEACAGVVAEAAGPHACIVEFGSGASRKIRLLLDAMVRPKRYIAIDISRDFLGAAANAMRRDYPALEVLHVCADYSLPLPALPIERGAGVLGFFPGSSIANMEPADAVALLNRIRAALAPGWLLVGQDHAGDAARLKRAYGGELMASFHKNILTRLAREFDAQIQCENFEHEVRVLENPARVEAHIVARKATTIKIGTHETSFGEGESIRTDMSWKHTPAGFQRLLSTAGWTTMRSWTDADRLYGLYLLRAS